MVGGVRPRRSAAVLVRCDRCHECQPAAWRCRRCRALLPHARRLAWWTAIDAAAVALLALGWLIYSLAR